MKELSQKVELNNIATSSLIQYVERNIISRIDKLELSITSPDECLTSKDVCQLLKIGNTKLYDLINKDIIKQYELDGAKRYSRKQILEVLFYDSSN